MAKKRILIIDDEVIFLELLQAYLEEKGFEVTVAESGQKILKLLFERPYDVVLLDVWMVDMSGIDVLKKIRKANPKLPVVLMTGYTSQALLDTMQELEVDAFVKKPFKLGDVLDAVTRLVERTDQTRTSPEAPKVAAELYNVLIADDDPQYLQTMHDMLAGEGFKALLAQDGAEAWTQLQAHPEINLLILDVRMPRLDGPEVLKKARERNPDAVAIFVTALDDPGLHKRLIEEQGAYAVFQKPFSYQQFLRFVEMTEQLKHVRTPSPR